jgi:septal ring factor EnvC (AmiA/AmiB activator)
MSDDKDTLARVAEARTAHEALAPLRAWAKQNGMPDLYHASDRAVALADDVERLMGDLDKAQSSLVAVQEEHVRLSSRHYSIVVDLQARLAKRSAEVEEVRVDVRTMCSRLEDRDTEIGELRNEREEIRQLLGAGPCESAMTAARRVANHVPNNPDASLVDQVALTMVRSLFGPHATLQEHEAGPWRTKAAAAIAVLRGT